MKAGEPGTAAAWPRLGPRAGRHRLQHGQAAHIVWVGRCERKRRRPAPVLSGEQHRAKAKLGDEPVEIVSTSGDIVGLRARIRIPESAEIYGDDGVMLRQPRHNISPRIPSVREPVQQNDRRPGTSDHVMRPRVIHQPPFTGKTRRRSRRLLETGRAGHVRSWQLLAHRSPAGNPHGRSRIKTSPRTRALNSRVCALAACSSSASWDAQISYPSTRVSSTGSSPTSKRTTPSPPGASRQPAGREPRASPAGHRALCSTPRRAAPAQKPVRSWRSLSLRQLHYDIPSEYNEHTGIRGGRRGDYRA